MHMAQNPNARSDTNVHLQVSTQGDEEIKPCEAASSPRPAPHTLAHPEPPVLGQEISRTLLTSSV